MARYTILPDLTKSVKKALTKFGTIPVDTEKIKGTIKITGYRKYTWGEQIDLEFNGSIRARAQGKLEWLDSSIMEKEGVRISKVKVNRFIKRSCLIDVQHRLNYFGITIREYSNITKIKWS